MNVNDRTCESSKRSQKIAGRPLRIGVFRALKLGDMLNTIPAFRALRRAFPEAEVTLIGLPWAEEFVDRFTHLLDNFICFPGIPGFPEQEPRIDLMPGFLEDMQAHAFDILLQLHGDGSLINPIIELCGASTRGGFYPRGCWKPEGGYWIEYPAKEPESWRMVRVLQAMGIPPAGMELEFPLTRHDVQNADLLLGTFLPPSAAKRPVELVCLHPGADTAQHWTAEQFAQVGDFVSALGFQVVLTGTEREKQLVEAVKENMCSRPILLAGLTDLGTLGALISRCRLLVCHDTGVSHLAAALETPSVIIFNRSELEGWPPMNRQLHRFITDINGVDVETVCFEAADVLLRETDWDFPPHQIASEPEILHQ